MKCPVCTSVNLHMTDRQGVEIDYCPQCRGVWLDRGELDKLIERATGATGAIAAPAARVAQAMPAAPYPPQRHHDERSHHGQGYDNRDYRTRKKKGFLGEIFDFD